MSNEHVSLHRFVNRIRSVLTTQRPAGPPDTSLEDRNIRHACGEIGWVSVLDLAISTCC